MSDIDPDDPEEFWRVRLALVMGERDSLRAKAADAKAIAVNALADNDALTKRYMRVAGQRDEALAEVERLRAALSCIAAATAGARAPVADQAYQLARAALSRATTSAARTMAAKKKTRHGATQPEETRARKQVLLRLLYETPDRSNER